MGVSGQTVRVGIAAPDGVRIYREEIWLAVTEENRAAAEAAGDALQDAPALATPADAGPVASAVAPDSSTQASAAPDSRMPSTLRRR